LDDEDMTASDALECHTDDGRCSGAGLDERKGNEMGDRLGRGKGQMKMRFAAVAGATTAILLLSACGGSDDASTTASTLPTTTSEAPGPTSLAMGDDVELVGNDGLGAQTLTIHAEEVNGKATGEFRVADNVIRVDCADTDTDSLVVLGGEVTEGPDFPPGDLVALIIREGDPDSVSLYANDSGAASCAKLLKSIPDSKGQFVDVEDGFDIETA
jgi:hypothetical protein